MTAGVRLWVGIAVLTAAVAAVVGGLVVAGSPAEARLRRLDDRRVGDLRRMASAVDLYWTRTDALPASASDLEGSDGLPVSFEDPETGTPYEYRVTGPESYELCAVFARTTEELPLRTRDRFWAHGEGRQCFEATVEEIEREPRTTGR